jgi:hypothetical protein
VRTTATGNVKGGAPVLLILLTLLLAFLFLGLGFAVHLLWIAAFVFFVAWVAGFAFRRGSGHWYWW